MARGRMNKYCLSQRLNWYKRTKGPALVRDIAWAQLCVPDLLEKFEIQPLTTQQLSIVKQIYKHQGGLAEAQYLYLRDEQIVKGGDGIWSISNEEYYGALETAEALQENQEPPTKKVKIEGDDGDAKKEYTPNRALQAKYGTLDVDYNEPVLVKEESPNIPADQIPVGIFRDDPAPARLITATLDPADQNIRYTIQPNDRNFVKVKLHEGHLVENGTSWPSEGDAVKDSETIIFLRTLQDKDFDEVRRYVFRELRREGQFENLWTSFDDMLEQPGLLLMADRVEAFTSGGRAGGLAREVQGKDVLKQLREMAKIVNDLGLEVRSLEQDHMNLEVECACVDTRTEAGKAIEDVWAKMGKAWRGLLLLRRGGA